MPDMKLPNYFYGDEAMQFTYFRIPCQLITHPRYKHLSTDSKLLYGMLLDRMSLSIKNEWYDDTGRVYIYYTVVRGDNLSKIAKQHYGDSAKWRAIYEANKSLIKDPNKIWPGQVLILPAA